MYARGPCGNGDDLARLGSEHVAGGGDELGEHERRSRGRRGLEVVPGGRERPPERGGQGQGGAGSQAAVVGRSGEEPDEALFRRGRRPGHATRRCAAAATSAGVMSPRQR